MSKKAQIVYNAIRTPDGTVIESKSVHDYVQHLDTKNGKEYAVDGGLSYLRRAGQSDYKELSLTTKSPFKKIREKLKWGTFGKNGDKPLCYVKLKDMTKGHIKAVLKLIYVADWRKKLLEKELEYRKNK